MIVKNQLTNGKLTTLALEMEGIMAARPLTYVAEDTMELIRLIDFLLPIAVLRTPSVSEGGDGYKTLYEE